MFDDPCVEDVSKISEPLCSNLVRDESLLGPEHLGGGRVVGEGGEHVYVTDRTSGVNLHIHS